MLLTLTLQYQPPRIQQPPLIPAHTTAQANKRPLNKRGENKSGERNEKIPERLEEQLQGVKLTYGKPLIVIDPARHEARVYHILLEEEQVMPVYTGRNPGPKKRAGDNKTPENRPGEAFYGIEVDDYTNATSPWDPAIKPYNGLFLRIDTPDRRIGKLYRSGRSPIGLHGVGNRPIKRNPDGTARTYNLTHGCLAFENKDHHALVEKGYFCVGTAVVIKSGLFGGIL